MSTNSRNTGIPRRVTRAVAAQIAEPQALDEVQPAPAPRGRIEPRANREEPQRPEEPEMHQQPAEAAEQPDRAIHAENEDDGAGNQHARDDAEITYNHFARLAREGTLSAEDRELYRLMLQQRIPAQQHQTILTSTREDKFDDICLLGLTKEDRQKFRTKAEVVLSKHADSEMADKPWSTYLANNVWQQIRADHPEGIELKGLRSLLDYIDTKQVGTTAILIASLKEIKCNKIVDPLDLQSLARKFVEILDKVKPEILPSGKELWYIFARAVNNNAVFDHPVNPIFPRMLRELKAKRIAAEDSDLKAKHVVALLKDGAKLGECVSSAHEWEQDVSSFVKQHDELNEGIAASVATTDTARAKRKIASGERVDRTAKVQKRTCIFCAQYDDLQHNVTTHDISDCRRFREATSGISADQFKPSSVSKGKFYEQYPRTAATRSDIRRRNETTPRSDY